MTAIDAAAIDADLPAIPTSPAPTSAEPAAAPRRKRRGRNAATIAAISFSFTFLAASLAFLAGLLPPAVTAPDLPVDIGVLLLAVPMFALVFAILGEAVRIALGARLPKAGPHRSRPALSGRRPRIGRG